MRTLHFSGAALLLASLAGAQQISFTEIATINLDITANNANAEFIGSNPSAVAYDGLNLTVAGLNNSGVTGFSALVTVTDPLGTAVISICVGALERRSKPSRFSCAMLCVTCSICLSVSSKANGISSGACSTAWCTGSSAVGREPSAANIASRMAARASAATSTT